MRLLLLEDDVMIGEAVRDPLQAEQHAVDGVKDGDAAEFALVTGRQTPGRKVALEVWRQGARQEINARLGDASDKPAKVAGSDDDVDEGKLGLALRPLQPNEKREASVDDGLLIENAAGPSARAGGQPGDLLLASNGTPARRIDRVRKVAAQAGKSVPLLIQRGSDKIFVPVDVG